MDETATAMVTVISIYKFVTIADGEALQGQLRDRAHRLELRGTLLIATEGINGTLAGAAAAIAQFLSDLQTDTRFAGLTCHYSQAEVMPFQRLKVKIKPEIVTLGQPAAQPLQQVGEYVAPQDWNDLITDPEVVVVDTRNAFEVRMGSFQGAVDPHTQSFRQFPDYAAAQLDPTTHKKVAMFCTGGIRCEKATSYLLNQGFEAVYHLQGGILNYLKTVPPEESLWRGDCFVFDDRIAVQHGLEPVPGYKFCPTCGNPVAESDRQLPADGTGDRCPYCPDAVSSSAL